MTKIKVQLLNFHAFNSHIEILLENTSVKPSSYYSINRWEMPENAFSEYSLHCKFKHLFAGSMASSIYTFYIDADPKIICQEWQNYFYKTLPEASIFNNNCAVSAQWFLNTFAHIPDPCSAPVSLNHLICGIFIPSSLPIGITLPGRIMDNAKFHIVSENFQSIKKYSSVLNLEIAMTVLKSTSSPILGIIAASLFLSGSCSTLVVGSCITTGAVSLYGLFNSTRMLAIRKLAESSKNDPPILKQNRV